MRTDWYVVFVAFFACLATASMCSQTASAQAVTNPDGCDADHDHNTIVCEANHFQVIRNKARVGQLLCEALDMEQLDPSLLPAELLATCESASLTSGIWADAQTKRKHEKAGEKAQRAAHRCQGQLKESRASDTLHVQQRDRWRSKARTETKWRKFWRDTAIGTGAAAILGGSLLICDAAKKCPVEF